MTTDPCPCLCHTSLGAACSNTCCADAGEIQRPATLMEVFDDFVADGHVTVGGLRVHDPFMDAFRETVERQPRDSTGRWVPCEPPPCPPLDDIDLDNIVPLRPPPEVPE